MGEKEITNQAANNLFKFLHLKEGARQTIEVFENIDGEIITHIVTMERVGTGWKLVKII